MVLGTRNELDRIVEIFNLGKVELIDELFAPDYINRTPWGRYEPTRDGFKKSVTALKAGFPDLRYTLDESIYSGDKLVHRVTGSGTMTGEYNGMPPTGKRATWTEIHISRVLNGRVVEHWGVVDQLSMLVQLGVIPAPGRELVAA